MVKPRLIILVRHAQSEGNKNREIHQLIPDHKVKLTELGLRQAEEAGRRLRALLKPDDTLQIFTSPYRRTRETTEGILKTLTARHDPDDPSAPPSPFSRSKITVYEEPRLREQDFGNFQPCSAEMERMWAERADYGHFFYRIPNGESAADVYDRVSGFNESLWRQFGDDDFPSVCVLVTHGLLTRVFLSKWYHWSVEYFEDLRNVNHCEFVLMRKNSNGGKYSLETQLRTWSELKRQRQVEEKRVDPQRRNTLSNFLTQPQGTSPNIPPRKWGGCIDGCNHHHEQFPRRDDERKQQLQKDFRLPLPASDSKDENTGHVTGKDDAPSATQANGLGEESSQHTQMPYRPLPSYLQPGRDGGGTTSGTATPHERSEEEGAGYFSSEAGHSLAEAMRKAPQRKTTPDDIERWVKESGMGAGKKADLLGDEAGSEDEDDTSTLESTRPGKSDLPARGDRHGLEEAERIDRSVRGSVY